LGGGNQNEKGSDDCFSLFLHTVLNGREYVWKREVSPAGKPLFGLPLNRPEISYHVLFISADPLSSDQLYEMLQRWTAICLRFGLVGGAGHSWKSVEFNEFEQMKSAFDQLKNKKA
jgi:hypothetical protein